MIRKSKKALELLKKTVITMQKEGVNGVTEKTKKYFKRRRNLKYRNHYRDFLFINGCSLEHPSRYRVTAGP